MTSVYSCLKNFNDFEVVGYSDLEDKNISDLKYLGRDDDLSALKESGIDYAFVCVGSVGNPKVRKKIYQNLKNLNFVLPNIIDKTAVCDTQNLGDNIFIGKTAVVNAGCSIGNMAIINTGAIVEHDCKIGDFVHIAPGSVLCGNCEVGENSHVGAGSVVIQGIKIGKNSVIGAGSVVVKDIPDNVVAFGNPCKVVRVNE